MVFHNEKKSKQHDMQCNDMQYMQIQYKFTSIVINHNSSQIRHTEFNRIELLLAQAIVDFWPKL